MHLCTYLISCSLPCRLDTPLSVLFKNDFWGTSLLDPESHKSYRPLTTLTFRWNHQLHGMKPSGYHLVNIFLHSFVCVLLYGVFIQVGVDQDTSLVASLLFAVHPIHTEAVRNVAHVQLSIMEVYMYNKYLFSIIFLYSNEILLLLMTCIEVCPYLLLAFP